MLHPIEFARTRCSLHAFSVCSNGRHTQEDLDAVWPPTPGSQLRLFISLPGLSRSRDSSQCEPSSAPSPASTQGTVGQEAIDRPQGQGAAHHPPDAGPDPLNRIQQQHPSTASNTSSLHPSEAEAQKVRHGCDSSPSQAQLLHTLKSLVQVLDHSHKQSAAAARTVHATPTANAPLNTPDPALSSQTHTSWRPPPPPRTSPTHPHHHHPPWPPHCGPPPHHGHGHGPSPSPVRFEQHPETSSQLTLVIVAPSSPWSSRSSQSWWSWPCKLHPGPAL